MSIKRLRVFAGPNGSGKSTITRIVEAAGIHLGVYINADDLKRTINNSGKFDFSSYSGNIDINHFFEQFTLSSLYDLGEGEKIKAHSKIEGHCIYFSESVNDYFTSFRKQSKNGY